MPKLIVPDFDIYPVTYTLNSAQSIEGGIELKWNDGVISQLPNVWLREFSPDIETFHPVTREQVLQVINIPDQLIATEVYINNEGFLSVCWQPEAMVSCYHPGWLRAHLPEHSNPVYALPERQLWQQGMQNYLTWEDGLLLHAKDRSTLQKWAEALHIHGLGLVRDLPCYPEIIPEIPELLGPIRHSNFGATFDVVNRPDANTNAYTSLALAAHTDLSTREYVPGLQFLFCLVNEVNGGNSILADGFKIAEQLKQESSEFYEVLSSVAIPCGTKDQNSDHRFTAPILEHDQSGQLSTIRYTYWLRSPMQGSFSTITTYYAALRCFQKLANDPQNQIELRLEPGEMLAFDNRRVLHGRTAFDPASGQRRLRGCYGEREELHSRLFMLSREQRQCN